MTQYASADSPFWVDLHGSIRKTPAGKKLHFSRIPLHSALRAFVFIRDGFTCQNCGTLAVNVGPDFDGVDTPFVNRKSKAGYQSILVVDHIISRRNGGTNHPINLQALCDCCNAAKSGLVDAKVGK